MKKIFSLFVFLCQIFFAKGQSNFNVYIKDSSSKEPLAAASASIYGTNINTFTNQNGFATLNNIPDGKHTLKISYAGATTKMITILFPTTDTMEIFLNNIAEDLNEVIIQSTRTKQTIANTPTRVEYIDAEELDEKSNMRPANVSMLLHESTGLQVQQTSVTSGNSSIRVQGLDGKYTQLLKDGYPNFGNFASGLSLLQIAPLDLKQVEIIKGPSSTLYGGGAIAGVINFISKTPGEKANYDVIINQSNVGQTNIGGYASQKKGKWGYSILALYNNQLAYDADKDDFSELPKSNSFTINPRIFFYPNETTRLLLGNSFSQGNNTGGDMQVIKGNAGINHVYFEKNTTSRNTSNFELDKKFGNKQSLKIKQSLSFFDRKISIPGYTFSGLNINSFTDVSYLFYKKNQTIIAGVNFVYDDFKQKQYFLRNNQNAKTTTLGLYAQDTWAFTQKLKVEYGARLDEVHYTFAQGETRSEVFILPRISALYKISNRLSSRIGGGFGYKIPTIFTEETETIQYRNILPLSNVIAEKSIGVTADINYKTAFSEEFSFSINQLFFYTAVKKPLVLQSNTATELFFINANKPLTSQGFETNVRLTFLQNFKFFAGYTYVKAQATYLKVNQHITLSPSAKFNGDLMYEKENDFKFGLEGYRTGTQFLNNGTQTPAYWEFGAMAQKTFHKISLFINFENFTDQRQSKYKPVVNAPYNNPSFDDIWNHTEGFVINGGIKIKW